MASVCCNNFQMFSGAWVQKYAMIFVSSYFILVKKKLMHCPFIVLAILSRTSIFQFYRISILNCVHIVVMVRCIFLAVYKQSLNFFLKSLVAILQVNIRCNFETNMSLFSNLNFIEEDDFMYYVSSTKFFFVRGYICISLTFSFF